MAAWKSAVSGWSCTRRRSSTGVRSAPPPNQVLVVTMKRVFMWTAGTKGFHGWMMSEMPRRPEARVFLGPGDLLAELGRELAMHGGRVDARLLENLAVQHGHDAAAAIRPLPGLAREAGAALDLLECGADPVAQLLEPLAGGSFAVGKQVCHGRFLWVRVSLHL